MEERLSEAIALLTPLAKTYKQKWASNFKSFTYDTESSKEGEDFCTCSNCEQIIHQSIIVTNE